MFRINYILLTLFLACGIAYSGQGKVKIILENGYYYTQLETGEKFEIVKQVDWALNKIVFSPDGKYLAYTTSNWLGFENEGRDVYYCKVDGTERTFLHKFELSVDTLLWCSSEGRDFIFVVSWDCHPDNGGIQVIDLKSGSLFRSLGGNRMAEIQWTDCYQIYCSDKPLQAGIQRICLKDLMSQNQPDSLNSRFFIGWGNWDIYISTQRDQILRFNDLSKSTKEQEQALRRFMWSSQFLLSKISPNRVNNRIVFSGGEKTSGFFGVVDTENKKLLLFDKSDTLRFSKPTWSSDGRRLAILRVSDWDKYIDFYDFTGPEKRELIKTYKVMTDRPISDFRWSSDSKKFYFSYHFTDYQKVETEIDLTDK